MQNIKKIFKNKISHGMKTLLSKVPYLIIAILVGLSISYAGSLTPPGSVANTMYSLTDIFNLSTGTTTTVGSGTISATPGSVVATGKTLTEVYDALSTQIGNLANNKIAKDVTAFGFTGTLYGDTDPSKVLDTATYAGTATAGLLKTGQTHCNAYSGAYGSSSQIPCTGTAQDGETQTGLDKDYVDNGDGTITDNTTGLMWQKCSNGQTELDCSGGSPTVLNFDDGDGGLGISHQPVINYCDSLSLATHTDWRLPNVKELTSIVDYGRFSPSIDPTYFPNTQSDYYWSSTAYESDTNSAWIVLFSGGYVGYDNMFSSNFARCVRE